MSESNPLAEEPGRVAERHPGLPVGLGQRLAVRTAGGRSRVVWRAGFALLIGLLARLLRFRTGATIYVRGSFGSDEPVYGLSDVDMVALVQPTSEPGAARARVLARWRLVSSPLPRRLVKLNVFELPDLEEIMDSTIVTDGRTDGLATPRAPLLARGSPRAHYAARLRPGLYSAASDWRRLVGHELRPTVAVNPGERWARAWLELQCWWRYAFWASVEPSRLRASDLCVKLVAEPLRVWLWMARGERHANRREAIESGLSSLPEERATLERAFGLLGGLPRADEPPPLAESLAFLARISTRLAGRFAEEAESAGGTRVRLLWPDAPAGSRAQALPLLDWRALVAPAAPEESIVFVPGDPVDPADLARIARDERADGPRHALRADGIFVLPTLDLQTRPLIRGALRAVQCAATDPVTFALAADRPVAIFPNIAGYSAPDVARRAAAEHRAWLDERNATGAESWTARDLGLLLTYARAVLFLESLGAGDAELPVTVAGALQRLERGDRPLGELAREVAATCSDPRGGEPKAAELLARRLRARADHLSGAPLLGTASLPAH